MSPGELLEGALREAFLDLAIKADERFVSVKAQSLRPVKLEAVSAGQGWPTDVRALLTRLAKPWNRHRVAIAPRFSPGAIRVLVDGNANWADSAGEVRIICPPLLIRSFPRAHGSVEATAGDLPIRWSNSLLDITEWLLMHPGNEAGVSSIAASTGWTAGLVSRSLQILQRHGWMTQSGKGPFLRRTLANPGSLLEAWSAAVGNRRARERRGYVFMPQPAQFVRSELRTLLANTEYALTGYGAALYLAPYMTVVPSVEAYVESLSLQRLWQRWLDSSDPLVKPVAEGANLTLIESDRRIFRYATVNEGTSIAGAVRVYADLLRLGGRAADAAEHIRKTVIGF